MKVYLYKKLINTYTKVINNPSTDVTFGDA